MIYLILYCVLFIFCLYDLLKGYDENKSNKVAWIIIILFTLFRGLRWDTGTDWDQFYELFQKASFSNIFSYYRYGFGSEKMEFGYVFLNSVVNHVTNYTGFLLMVNFAILYMYKTTIWKLVSNYRVFVLGFLINTAAFFPGRQELANAILIFALPFLQERRWKEVLICLGVAVIIHKSIFYIAVPLALLYNRNIKTSYLIGLYLSAYVLDFGFVQSAVAFIRPYIIMINSAYETGIDVYSSLISDETSFSLSSLVMNLLLIVLFCRARDNNDNLRNDIMFNFLLNVFVFYLFGIKLFTNVGFTYFVRLMKYLFFADALLFGYLLCTIDLRQVLKLKLGSFQIKLALIVLLCMLSYNRFIGSCNLYPGLMFPYISVLDNTTRTGVWMDVEFDRSMLFE